MKQNDTRNSGSGVTGKFSVALGLFDYINPIFYAVTVVTVLTACVGAMRVPTAVVFALGAVLSLVFGLSIPTVKLLVGLGRMPFKMPVNLVSFVNTGILLSGIALATHVLGLGPAALVLLLSAAAAVIGFLWYKTGKFNTAAVLIGAVGYLLLYASLITLAVRGGAVPLVVLYAFAVCLFIFLCLVGILADLKNARIHWVIEISNVICQGSVALATLLLFK